MGARFTNDEDDSAPRGGAAVSASPNLASGARGLVLIVDDQAGIVDTLAFFAKRAGYAICTAYGAREAIALAKEQPVDLIVSDIVMPEGTGMDLLKAVQDRSGQRPEVILMTGFSTVTTAEALDQGAVAVLTKPYSPKSLTSLIEKVLAPRHERWRVRHPGVHQDLELTFSNANPADPASPLQIGRGGLYASMASNRPPPQTIVNFTIHLADEVWGTLRGQAVVAYSANGAADAVVAGIGLEFNYLDEPTLQKLEWFIATTQPRAFIPCRRKVGLGS